MNSEANTAPRSALVELVLHELHAMAQPLTVLRGTLELALLEAQTLDQYRQSIESALLEAGRAALCLNHTREMICALPEAGGANKQSEQKGN